MTPPPFLFPWPGMEKGGEQKQEDTLLLTCPCDLAVEIGLELKRKGKGHPFFLVTQANDHIGYALPEKEYRQGGYEARMSFSARASGRTCRKKWSSS